MAWKTRKEIGDKYLRGFGIEIGAGLSRTKYANVDEMAVVDQRTAAEFETYFGEPPDYPLLTLGDAKQRFIGRLAFVVAHHVVEHCDNPIHTLGTEWIPLLAEGGLLYISLPSAQHDCEQLRLPTPIEHILDDYHFHRSSGSYESKEHIYSFILQWTVYQPKSFWYAKGDFPTYAAQALREAFAENQDLHWHTYTLPVAAQFIEAAFHVSRSGIEWVLQEEIDNELHLVCKRIAWSGKSPPFLTAYKMRLAAAVASIDGLRGGLTMRPGDIVGDWPANAAYAQQGWLVGGGGHGTVHGDGNCLTLQHQSGGFALYRDLDLPFLPDGLVFRFTSRVKADRQSGVAANVFSNDKWSRRTRDLCEHQYCDISVDFQANGRARLHVWIENGATVSISGGRVTVERARPETEEHIPPPSFAAVGRTEAVLGRIPLQGHGLELSPGTSPLVDKRDRKIVYCDKFGREDLSRLYPGGKFVDIDVVLGDRPLDQVFSKEQFDYIVSSHVIEHIPDFIQFFISASKILRTNGVIVSLLPDKRYTFDVLRQISSVHDIEMAHAAKLISPSDAMIEEFYRNCDMNASAEGLWSGTYKPERTHAPQEALVQIAKVDPQKKPDVHCYTFSPDTFRVLITHVIERHVPNLSLVEISDTPRERNEFLVHIRKIAIV
jgi:SAM-dependent methyltransferase